MSMQALNELVARSITDPLVVQAFRTGTFEALLSDLGFSTEMRRRLAAIEASNFAEFAVKAYRIIKAVETPKPRIHLPSALEGLLDRAKDSGEQVA